MEDPYQQQIPVEEEDKKKQGFWAKFGGEAFTIAVVLHVILAILGGIFIAQRIYQAEKKVDFLPGNGEAGGGERSAQSKVQQKKRSQITPTSNVKRVFAEGAASTFSIPDPGDNFGEMSALSSLGGGGMSGGLGGSGSGGGFGSGHGAGTGLGMGTGKGKLFGLIPETMRKRCSKEDRATRIKQNGGTAECEEAALKGLRWLKNNQNPNGSWGSGFTPAMTGLALLAYFGHCETPISEEFGESCLKGIVYLVGVGMSKSTGEVAINARNSPGPYDHAIATYALGEAATFCKDLKIEIPNLMEVTQKAGQFIIDNQNVNGGWAYAYNKEAGGHTDTSIVGWQLQALKACSHTNLKFEGMNKCVDKGLKYLQSMQAENGSFGYNRPGGHSLTGVGVLCHQMWGKGNSKTVKNGVEFIKNNFTFKWESADLYAHYYASQAMMQAGGSNWKHYNDLFRDELLKNQNPDGSWKRPGGNMHGATPVYINSLCILMLEVYYRFLNSTGSGGSKLSDRPI